MHICDTDAILCSEAALARAEQIQIEEAHMSDPTLQYGCSNVNCKPLQSSVHGVFPTNTAREHLFPPVDVDGFQPLAQTIGVCHMPDGSFPPRLYKMDSIPTEAAYSGNSSTLVEQYDRGKPVQYATPPNWEIPIDPVQTDPIHQSNGSLRPQFEGHVHKPSMEALFDVKHFNFKPGTFLQLSPKELHSFVKLQTDDNLKEMMKIPRAHLAFVIILRSYNDRSFISVDYRSRDPVEYGYSHGVPSHPLNPSDHRTIHTIRSRVISFVRHEAEKSEMTLGEFIGIHQLSYYEGEHFSPTRLAFGVLTVRNRYR